MFSVCGGYGHPSACGFIELAVAVKVDKQVVGWLSLVQETRTERDKTMETSFESMTPRHEKNSDSALQLPSTTDDAVAYRIVSCDESLETSLSFSSDSESDDRRIPSLLSRAATSRKSRLLLPLAAALVCLVGVAEAFQSSRSTTWGRRHQQLQSFSSNGSIQPYAATSLGRSIATTTRTTVWQLSAEVEDEDEVLNRYTNGNGDDDDQAEWKSALAAFQMYKAAYGDLKVPGRFIVPLQAPWPEPAWGLKLGRTVLSIRQTGKMVANNPARRKILDDLGFVWQIRKPRAPGAEDAPNGSTSIVTVQQVWQACKAYKELIQPVGPLAIPSNFVVPNADPWPETVRGLPLGQQVAALQDQLEDDVAWQERFAAIGYYVVDPAATHPGSGNAASPFDTSITGSKRKPSASEQRFQKVYSALATYKNIYGDLLVPQPFVVPEETVWPQETWGLRLGARVNAIRSQGTFVNNDPDRRGMLDDLGFAWSPPKADRGRPGRKKTDEAFLPDFDSNSAAGAGVDASTTGGATDMESLFGATFDFDKDFLPQEGGDKAPVWGLEGGRELQEAAAAAAQVAKPAVDEYQPPRTLADTMRDATQRALEVGIIESVTPNKRVVKGKREKDIPWFNDDFGGDFVFEDVVEALTVYKDLYGDFSNFTTVNGEDFVIPGADSSLGFDDDELFDGFDVDASARAAAAISQYEEQGQTGRSDDKVASEIKRVQQEVGTSLKIDMTAVTKETKAAEWPEHLVGMALGSIISRIKDGSLEVKHIPQRKKLLNAIKFDWGDKMRFMDVPFEKAMCAMYAYYLVRGDLFVYEDFVMPAEDPWPEVLAGYELGKAVKRIRELQNFLEAYHSEKVSLLRMIDFVWFPTTALPLDPNETEMTSETLLLSAMGHPDYAKMIDIPMGLPDKIVADGPFLESDDPKQWWRKWHNWEYVKDYWYLNGRRDNAFVLRGMGYPQMADEHEAKYGPGLFQQITATMMELEAGIESTSQDEKKEILEKLDFYRQEMIGCTDLDIPAQDQILEDLDIKMIYIMKEGGLDITTADGLGGGDYEYESVDEDIEIEADADVEYEEDIVDEGVEEDVEEVEVEDFDVEDELGLDMQ